MEVSIIAGNRTDYSEDDFAVILAKAAELSRESSSQGVAGRTLSIPEMKAIAAEVGLDPDLVERAAHLVPGVSRPSLSGRLFGGPLSARLDFQLPFRIAEDDAEHLLSLLRATLLTQGHTEATAAGMSFASFEGLQRVFVSATPAGDGSRIRIVVDNRSRLFLPVVLAPLGTLLVFAVAIGLGGSGPEDPYTALPWVVLGLGIPTVAGLLIRSLRGAVQRTLGTLDELVGILSSHARRKT